MWVMAWMAMLASYLESYGVGSRVAINPESLDFVYSIVLSLCYSSLVIVRAHIVDGQVTRAGHESPDTWIT